MEGLKQEKRPLATLGEMLRYPRVVWRRPEPAGKTGYEGLHGPEVMTKSKALLYDKTETKTKG